MITEETENENNSSTRISHLSYGVLYIIPLKLHTVDLIGSLKGLWTSSLICFLYIVASFKLGVCGILYGIYVPEVGGSCMMLSCPELLIRSPAMLATLHWYIPESPMPTFRMYRVPVSGETWRRPLLASTSTGLLSLYHVIS